MISINELQEKVNDIFGTNRFVVKNVFKDGGYLKCKIYCPICDEEGTRRVAHVLAGHKCKKCGSIEFGIRHAIPVEEKQRMLDEQIPNNTLTISYEECDGEAINHQGELKKYKLYCSSCGETWSTSWNIISRYKICPKCLRIRRSVAYQHPEFIQYFVNPDEAHQVAAQSNKKVKLKCPQCGAEKEMIIGNLHKRGFSCDVCGTGKSFPEKFMASIFDGNGIEYIAQYSPDWACGRKYDFYLPSHDVIVETHGMQHYQDVPMFPTSAEEQQKIDQIKERAAKTHGCQYYVIDCSYSNMDYIEQSMKDVGLIADLHLTITDNQRKKAYIDDEKSMCWKLYDEGKDIHYLAKKFHHDIREIREYLKTGAKLGLCTYQKYHKVAQVDTTTGEIKQIFNMIKDAAECLGVPQSTLSRWCKQGGKILYENKYRIIWLNDYDKYFSQEEDAA